MAECYGLTDQTIWCHKLMADGLLAEFASIVDAVECDSGRAHRWRSTGPFRASKGQECLHQGLRKAGLDF